MKKSKKLKVKIVMHQHQDKFGKVFGALHPLAAKHKKESTQKYHDITIERN